MVDSVLRDQVNTATTTAAAKSSTKAADTKKAGSLDALNNLTESFENFIQLLLVQLKNQDPTQPFDTNEFTNQMVNMTGVQAQVTTNGKLDALVQQTKTAQLSSAFSLTGSVVEIEGNKVEMSNKSAGFSYELPAGVESATVVFTDKTGTQVRKIALDDTQKSAGKHLYGWDGKDDAGKDLKDGVYSVKVVYSDKTTAEAEAKTTISSIVNAVNITDGNINLMLSNGMSTDIAKVLYVGGKAEAATS